MGNSLEWDGDKMSDKDEDVSVEELLKNKTIEEFFDDLGIDDLLTLYIAS